jgi:uncharacterized damage-inducible protein DinB
MNKQDILTLYKYNQWANAKILNATAHITQDQFLASASFPHGAMRDTLVHTLHGELIYRRHWEGLPLPGRLRAEEFPTFESLLSRWVVEETRLMAFVEELTDEKLCNNLEYLSSKGPYQIMLWQVMAHVVNHGTQHRSEAAAMLTDFGQSPGDVDLIYFLTESKAQ